MNDNSLTCPSCGTEIKLTESLAAPLVADLKKDYEAKLAKKDIEAKLKDSELKKQQADIVAQRESLNDELAKRITEERKIVAAEEAKKARTMLAGDLEQKAKELTDLQDILKQRDEKLAEAQKTQVDLLRKQRELDDQKRELDLTIEKKVQESLQSAREQGKRAAEDELKLKVQEKEHLIGSMQKQMEEMKRKMEQGSQQLQGEVLELELEATLAKKFPLDRLEPVAKGEFGGDVLQRVMGTLGQSCGTILWESKRTKTWSDGWLSKLREDQRRAKADVAIIVTQALPKDVHSFDLIDDVWVTSPACALPVALALRESLAHLATARQASEGQQTKMELVYQYLTGPRFRQRIQAIVEKFTDMQDDLDKERKMMLKQWSKREEQIRGVIESTTGMYGDLQGIAGKSLPEIPGMEIDLIEEPR